MLKHLFLPQERQGGEGIHKGMDGERQKERGMYCTLTHIDKQAKTQKKKKENENLVMLNQGAQ